ncbi:MAG: hypothetical protein EHM90_05605, partial [Chloroflexi bacterium]
MSRSAPPAGGGGSVRAIGRLGPEGPWVGFASSADGHRLVFGRADGSVAFDPTTDPGERRAGLVAAAVTFFLAALADPPAELEATQADIASLVSGLATGEVDAAAAWQEALDAIDDGLPAEAVALRLQRL